VTQEILSGYWHCILEIDFKRGNQWPDQPFDRTYWSSTPGMNLVCWGKRLRNVLMGTKIAKIVHVKIVQVRLVKTGDPS